MRPTFRILAIVAAALSGCSQFPELDASVSAAAESAPYPDLVPVETLTTQITEPRITEDATTALNARIARLRARATRLRGAVIDSDARNRMRHGVSGA